MDLCSNFICLLSVFYLHYVEACLKNPDNGGGSSSGYVSTTPSGPTSPCTAQEEAAKMCLNGAPCTVSIFLGNRDVHCSCPPEYEGARCEIKISPLTGNAGGMYNVAAIIGIIIGVIVLLAILAGIIFLILRKKRKDSRPKFEEPSYVEEIHEKRSSNFAASKHFYNSNQRTFSNFGPGLNNFGYSSDVSSNPNPPPYTISGNISIPSKRSGMTITDSDEKDNQSSRPPSSSGGSILHTSGSLGPIKIPLAFHETGV